MNDKYKRITQILSFFALQNGSKQISKLKVLKLIWAADRYHVRKYGRLISDDIYFAMKLGPVASEAKNIAEADEYLSEPILEYSSDYIHPNKGNKTIRAKDGIDKSYFSKSDIEALEFAWKNFGHHEKYYLSETITHIYPEWKKHETMIKSGRASRVTINIEDFFENPTAEDIAGIGGTDPFEIDSELLNTSKEVFEDLYAR